MKLIIVMITLLAQMVMAGAALAVPVTLVFTNAPGVDVTTESPVTLNGVTISHDDQESLGGYANVGTKGIIGSTVGTLIFDFVTPATALNLGFSLQEAVSDTPQIAGALDVIFFTNGDPLGSASAAVDFFASNPDPNDPLYDPKLGFASGTFAYSGSAFDHVELFFLWTAAPLFTVSNVSYEPVPEPGTIMLLSAGLFGLAVYGRRRMES